MTKQGMYSELFLLKPSYVYAGLTLLYFLPSFISGIFFSDVPILFLSPEASNKKILLKGLAVTMISIGSFIIGTSSAHGERPVRKSYVALSAPSILRICILLISVGIFIYGPGRYFLGGYAVYENDSRWEIGNGIIYFCGEILVGLALVVELYRYKKIRPAVLAFAGFTFLLLIFRLKRLELVIACLSAFCFYCLIKKITMRKIFFFILSLGVIASMVGSLRQGIGGDLLQRMLLSLVFEANFTCNSFYGTIYLVDELNYPHTMGATFLSIPIQIIPSFLFPFKYDVIDFIVDPSWSGSYNLSPLGASFGLSHLYREGGILFVAIFSFLLGYIFQVFYKKFMYSYRWNIRSFYLYFYPIALYSFFFHFVRDDVRLAFKFLFQLGILFVILVIIKSNFDPRKLRPGN